MKEKEIYSVENAKVVERNYRFYSINTRGYMKIDDSLVYVTVTAVVVDLKNQIIKTTLIDVNNTEIVRAGEFKLFNSPKDYENNDPMITNSWRTLDLLKKADYKRLCDCRVVSIEADEENPAYNYLTVWIFEKGEAVEIPIVINSIAIEQEKHFHLIDGFIPEKFWESRKDAYSFNEYKVVDDDGETFIEQGVQKRIGLTPEQWIIVNKMKELAKEAEEANIKFLWDREYCGTVKAMNMQYVNEIGYDILATDGGSLIEICDCCFADTGIDFFDWCHESEYAIAMKPTEREKKLYLKEHPESENK